MAKRLVLFGVVAVALSVLVACAGRGGASISVSPSEVTLVPGESVEFTATVLGAADNGVTWTSTGGQLVPSGMTAVFTAPVEVGEYEVRATSAGDRGRWATAVVTVEAPEISYVEIRPGSVTLVAQGDEAVLEVLAFDASGATVSLGGYEVDWRIGESVAVDLIADPDEPTRATARASGPLGSAIVSAAVVAGVELLSNPIGISVASVRADVEAVPDDLVVFPFADLPPRADPATFAPPGYDLVEGVPSVVGFMEDEIAALLAVEDTTLLYPVILHGEPPMVGEVLLGTGGSAIMGRVRSVQTRAGAHLVQLAQVGLDEAFVDYVFSFNSAELEAQGVLTQSSWRGADQSASVAPSAGYLPLPDCEFDGGLTAVGLEATLNPSLAPILEADVDLRAGKFLFLVGIRGTISGQLGIDIQGGVTGTMSCDAGARTNLTMPLPAGPLATLLSAGAAFQPQFKVTVEASIGPRFGVTGELGFETTVQAGFDAHDGTVDNLSGITPIPTAEFDLIADGGYDDMDFSLVPGYYFEGDVGIQLGGWTLEKACALARFVPKVGEVCENVTEALFLEALQGSIGAELQTVWHSPRRVLNQEDSESRILTAGVAGVALGNDALNEVLKRFKFAPVELELVAAQLEGPTLYRVFQPASIEVTSSSYVGRVASGGVVEVEVGEILNLSVTGVREPAFLTLGDTPLHAGEVWISAGNEVLAADVTVVGEDALSIGLDVTAALCSEAVGGLVPLHFLAYNRMLGLVSTAGYLGNINLDCTVSDPPTVSVTVEPVSVTLEPNATQSFTATVTGVADTNVTWSTTCGSVSGGTNTITYTAPASAGTCSVTATSVADASAAGQATVSVTESGGAFEPGDLVWATQTGGVVVSSPAVGGDGRVYVGSNDGYLYALDGTTGSVAWRYYVPDAVFSSPAVASDGTVLFGGADDYVYALNSDGTLQWRFETVTDHPHVGGTGVGSSPAIAADGTIYVGASDGFLYALSPSGELRWRYPTGYRIQSGPSIGSDGTVYFGSRNGTVYAVRSDGTLRWQYATGAEIRSSAAVGSDGTVYIGSFDGYLYAIESNGSLRWRYNAGSSVYSSPAVGVDRVYVGSSAGFLHAVDEAAGLQLWRYDAGGPMPSSPAIGGDGTVYVGSNNSFLNAISPGGQLLWRYQAGARVYSSPNVGSNGSVYVGSNDGRVYAVASSSNGLANTAWPSIHRTQQNTGR